jgi:hypothetical protein
MSALAVPDLHLCIFFLWYPLSWCHVFNNNDAPLSKHHVLHVVDSFL